MWTFTSAFFKLLPIMLPNEPTNDFFDKRPFPLDSDLETIRCPLCGSGSTSIIHIRKPFQIVLCKDCGLSYLNPRLKEHVMHSVYEVREYFSAGDMTGYRDYTFQEKSLRITFRSFLAKLKRLGFASGRLLEVGCGYGYFLDEARDFFPSLFGTELSSEAASLAQKLPAVSIWTGDINSLPMGWSNFDVVVAINVIEHIYSPLEFLISLKQRLRSDGRIVLATPDFGSYWPKILGDKWPSFKIPEHVVFYNTKNLRLLLERAGFRNFQEIPFRHFFPLGLIAGKFGINISGRLGQIPVAIPKTMIALSAQK